MAEHVVVELSGLQIDFRAAMAAVPTPVSVVTTIEDGRPYGTTVSAFASLSMNPPMVLVSLDRNSNLLEVIQRTGTFGLNVLASHHSALATAFAAKGGDKFKGIYWHDEGTGARLDGAAAWVLAEVDSIIPAGDHFLLLGDVIDAHVYDFSPLTYYSRNFGTHVPL